MRIDRLVTNLRCNQNCGFCTERSPTDDRAFIQLGAVLRRLEAAVSGGAREIVITGGEPTLRRDLPEIVRRARSLGVSVVLETNATKVDREWLGSVDRVRVHVPGWGSRYEEITQDPGGFERFLRGLDVLLESGVALEASVPIVRANLDVVHELPRELAPRVRSAVLRVPTRAPSREALATLDEAIPAILAFERESRALGLTVKLAPDAAPPPCVFPAKGRPLHLWSMSGPASPRDDLRHVELCERCVVKDRCSGVPPGVTPREPILETRSRRRLSLISTVEEQIAREMVTRSIGDREGRALDEEVVRVNFHCNQVCTFCFVSTHLPAPEEDAVRDAIVQAAARGARVILSGGEPTLNPRLVEYVKLARETSQHPIELQTNAVRLEDRALAETLVQAGISEAFVSLHGSRAETSDAITNAPGTFEKTLRGLDNLHELGVRLRVNFVICRSNARELPELVELCATRWPSAFVNVSFVAPSTDVVPRDRELVPRYDEVLPFVSEAVERASRHGVAIGGFDSMCGIPLCLVPAPLERFFALSTLPEGHDGGEFEKPEACSRCALSSRCHGVRRGYLELHGDVELRPLAQ